MSDHHEENGRDEGSRRTPRIVAMTTLGVAGAVTTGLIAWQAPALASDDSAFKRQEDTPDIVLAVDDEDDDDTFARDDTDDDGGEQTTWSKTTRGTGSSRSRRDGTNSRYSKVSRDRDRSRGDRTKDWTRDGGDRTRDRSRGATNDRSRHDTRR